MIVVPAIPTDVSATEEPLQLVQHVYAPLSLNNRKGRLDLPAAPTGRVPRERHAEAAFAVDEADDPLRVSWPFLLIVRIGRIVTDHHDQATRLV